MDLVIKLVMLIIFFGVMIGIGLYCRKHATDVNGFVLGGRRSPCRYVWAAGVWGRG